MRQVVDDDKLEVGADAQDVTTEALEQSCDRTVANGLDRDHEIDDITHAAGTVKYGVQSHDRRAAATGDHRVVVHAQTVLEKVFLHFVEEQHILRVKHHRGRIAVPEAN